MVGPMLLMKILHCKKKSEKPSNEKIAQGTSSSRARHIVKKEPDQKKFICRVCLKDGHIPIFDRDKSKDISEALAAFGNIDIKVNDGFPKYLCSTCHSLLQGAILFRKTAQESDEILKKPPEPSPVQQEDDGDNKDFLDDMDLDGDAFNFHIPIEKRKDYHCKKCERDFETSKQYKEHLATEEHKARRRTCPVCKKSLSTVYYRKHILLHTQATPAHMCDICGKTFLVSGQLSRHRVTHFYDLPYKCELCPYRGRFTECLRLHMRQHTGEKPFQCSECAARFVTRSNMSKHMRTHRKHEYNCEMCGRGFYTKKTLEQHLRVDHTGIKDHVCNLCGKAFGYRKQMMKHQRKVHKREKLRSGKLPLYLQVEEMNENAESET